MKPLILIVPIGFLLASCSIKMEKEEVMPRSFKLSIEAEYPHEEATKVVFEGQDLAWEGSEKMDINIGNGTSATASDNWTSASISSVAKGKFSGTVDLGSFTAGDIKSVVIPAGLSPITYKNGTVWRLKVPIETTQKQAEEGAVGTDRIILYAPVSSSDFIVDEGTYSLGGLQLQWGCAVIVFNVYGAHPEMLADEQLKSVSITLADKVPYYFEARLNGGNPARNSTENSYTVNLENPCALAGRDKNSGARLFLIFPPYSSSITQVSVTTTAAVYTKTPATPVPLAYAEGKNDSRGMVYQFGLNLSTFDSRSEDIAYSVDGGTTWQSSIPSGFSSLAVRGYPKENTLQDILSAIQAQSGAVALYLSRSEYESTSFPDIFKACGKLSSISFPSNVTDIPAKAFEGCAALTSVSLDGIVSIGEGAFRSTALTDVTVPSSVTSIGVQAFALCYNLASVYYDSPAPTSGTHGVFSCRNQAANPLNTPDSPLTVTFGPNTVTIPRYCFDTNYKVTKIIIEGSPSMGNNWGIRALYLSTIQCLAATPPTGGSGNNMDSGGTASNQVGSLSDESSRIIIIPAQAFKAYNEADPWKTLVDARGFRLTSSEPAFPTADWTVADPAAHAFDAPVLNEISELSSGSALASAFTAIQVLSGGELIYSYGAPSDASYYIASARKSLLSMLYGKAVEDGTIDLSETIGHIGLTDVVEEGYTVGLTEQELTATVQHIIESRSGVYHKASNGGSSDEVNTLTRDQYLPGEHFVYNNWDFNAAGYIYEQKTGKNIFDAFQEQIAIPVGMQDWKRSAQYKSGTTTISKYQAYHFRISCRDLARVGYLMLNKGRWGNKQLISSSWHKEMLTERTNWTEAGKGLFSYGYMWWLFSPSSTSYTWHLKGAYMAKGSKGNWLIVMPALDCVIVVKGSSNEASVDSSSLLKMLIQKVTSAYQGNA